jgi:hypothetical protein
LPIGAADTEPSAASGTIRDLQAAEGANTPTFPNGNNWKGYIPIYTTPDTTREGNKTIILTISADPGYYIVNSGSWRGTHTVTLLDDECSYTLSETGHSFSSSAATGSVTVTTSSGCPWTASSSASWVSITKGSSGSGNGTVTYSVQANTSAATRYGTLNIAGRSYTVTKAGDTQAPVIAPVPVSIITTSGATITWTTSEAADSQVD